MDITKFSQLANLRTEAVRAFEAELVEEFTSKRTQELTVSSVSELTKLSEAIQAVRTELSEREAEAEQPSAADLAAAADAAAAAIKADDEDEEAAPEAAEELSADEDEDDKDKEDKGKRMDASVSDTLELSPTHVETGDLGPSHGAAVIVAGADIPRIPAGSEFSDMRQVANAFITRRSGLRGLSPEGDGDNVVVASIQAAYPEDRQLGNDLERNLARYEAVASPQAVVASGGLCAPLEAYYGIQVISQAARPVRDSLPKFQADRGGVRFLPPPVLTDLTAAIGVTTAAQDAGTYGEGGGDTPFKPCLHVTCGVEQTVTVEAIHRCLTFGNFAARTYPEQVQAWLALAIAAHARRAETQLLDAIDAASTAVTGASSYSAVRTLLPQIDQAVAAYRSRNRTSDSLPLRILLPAWTLELLRADLARGFRGHDQSVLSVSDSAIKAWFSERSVNATFYIDGATGEGQVFGAQAAGALSAFPSTVVWYLFVEGSFVFLDGGTLDLGLVRDSTLNRTNDYQIFAETFEAVAFYGIESIKVTTTVCPNGSYAPVATAQAPCTS